MNRVIDFIFIHIVLIAFTIAVILFGYAGYHYLASAYVTLTTYTISLVAVYLALILLALKNRYGFAFAKWLYQQTFGKKPFLAGMILLGTIAAVLMAIDPRIPSWVPFVGAFAGLGLGWVIFRLTKWIG